MKRCALCHGRLGLGTRFGNIWNGRWWVHVRFCSVRCKGIYELTLVGFYLLLRQCKFLQQVLAGHRPQSTEAERLRDQSRDPRKFQGNTRAVLQLLTLISRHRLLSRWGPFLDAVNITIEALTTKTLPSPAAAIEDGRRD
jgi:hypothetical protein